MVAGAGDESMNTNDNQKPTARAATASRLLENDKVRVTEWRFRPGDATGFHRHELDYVVVPISTGRLTLIEASGERHSAELSHGVPYYRDAGVEHDVLYEGDGEFAFVEIELKPR